MSTVARPVALLACLAGCFQGSALVPPPAMVVMPFDPYGGAIYVPALVNGDSAWLMFDTGLSRTGLDRAWATSVGATPATDTSSTAVVQSLRLGELQLDRYQTALYPLDGLSEASGRPRAANPRDWCRTPGRPTRSVRWSASRSRTCRRRC